MDLGYLFIGFYALASFSTFAICYIASFLSFFSIR